MTPILWLHDHGVGVFPLIPGTKKSEVSFPTYTCTREQTARFHNRYGVRLGRCRADCLVVVDSDSPETETWVAVNLIDTPFMVRTARGVHRYYRTSGPLPSYIRRDGLSIENKNQGLYVVGPGSVHPTGIIYKAYVWSWRWEDIPFFPADFIFDDGSCGQFSTNGQPLVLPPHIFKNERHATLHKIMRSLVAHGVPLDGAMKACRIENEKRCRPKLEDEELDDAFLRRAFHQKDRADFVRSPKTGWDLCGSLIAAGLSVEAALVAVRAITPDFDPEHVDD